MRAQSFFLFVALFSIASTSLVQNVSAGSMTCKEIQALERSTPNFFKFSPYCSNKGQQLTLMIEQLRSALTLQGNDDVSKSTAEEMDQLAEGSEFTEVKIGQKKFQAVNIGAGGNPFIYLFNYDTKTFSGISVQDGTLNVNGEYCKVKKEL